MTKEDRSDWIHISVTLMVCMLASALLTGILVWSGMVFSGNCK